MNLALYELVGQYKALESLAESDDLPAEVIRDTLEGLTGELREKAVSVAHFVENLVATADAIDGTAELMLQRAKRLRTRAEAVREYLLFNMQASGITKIDSPFFTLAVRNNPPSVIVDNEAEIPAEFKVQPPPPPPRIDKSAIARAIKNGQPVPGCHVTQNQRLEIKL
jgi:hypothetical protein